MLRGWWTRSISSGDTEGPAPATAATLPIGQSRRFLEYVHEHLPGQLHRLCVLVRRMIRSQNDLPVGQLVLGAMPELVQRSHLDQAPPLQIVQIRVEPNLPQRHDYLQPLQSIDLAIQIWRAVRQLLRKRLVVGRSTARRSGDVKVAQCKTVSAINRGRLIGKAGVIQHRVHEVSRSVARKGTTRAVRSMRPRR